MAQIQGGTTYADGGQVTATNLNAHVNNAVLVPGAISDQSAVSSITGSETLMVLQSGALKKATLSQLPYINKDGSVAMTAELTLSSSTPVNPLSAASKGYVDTGLATKQATIGYTPVNKAGDTGVGPIALAADPVSAFQVATKQYVDTKQSALGFTPVNKAGDTMTGALTLAADPASPLQASTKQYVDAQVVAAGPSLVPAGAVMAFYRSTPPTGWIECNGQSTAGYPNLVALGILNAPDLRGEFVRGWDNGKGTDPGRSLGSTQTDSIQNISGRFAIGGTEGSVYGPEGPFYNTGVSGGAWGSDHSNTPSNPYVGFDASRQVRTSSETRPRNIALMYCIKT